MRKWMRGVAWMLAAALLVGAGFAAQAGMLMKGEVEILLSPDGCTASGAGVRIDGSSVGVYAAGVYRVRGALDGGQLRVKVDKDARVTLILDGMELSNPTEPAILVENAGLVTLELAEGSVNRVRSGEGEGSVEDDPATSGEEGSSATDEDATGGAIQAKDDLAISGEGRLEVRGYLNNGIHCSNRLTISGGDIDVEAANHGVKGKDGVTVTGGALNIRSGGDGVKSDAEDGEGYGTIEFAGGEVTIASDGDGAQAATALTVSGGALRVTSGGGAAEVEARQGDLGGWNRGAGWDLDGEEDSPSAKGLKAGTLLAVTGGEVAVDAADDALHSDGTLEIAGGALTLATGDDGAHADDGLTISGGALDITGSYEGIEAKQILISGGEIDVIATDDGLNASGGTEQWDMDFGMRGGFGGFHERGGFGGKGRMQGAAAPGADGGMDSAADDDEARDAEGGMPESSSERVPLPGGSDMDGDAPVIPGGELSAASVASGEMGERFHPAVLGAEGDLPAPPEGELPEAPADSVGMDERSRFAVPGEDGRASSLPGGAEGVASGEAEDSSTPMLRITGGRLHVNAEGDGLDSNGDLVIEGGEIVVDGPSRSGNGALDSGSESGGGCRVDGGTVLAIGASGMAESFDAASAQPSFRHDLGETLPAGSEIAVLDARGNVLASHTAAKSFSSVVFSSPELALGETYTLVAGEQSAEITMDSTSVGSGERSRWGR